MFVTRSFRFSFFILASLLFTAAIGRAQETEQESLPNPIVAPTDSGAYHAINQLPASIRSSAPFAREFYEFARHAGSSGTVDNDAYLRTFEEARQDMLRANKEGTSGKNSPQSTLGTWSNIGLTGADTIPSAGITTAIVFDPQHANIMYAGGSGGGVWKSFDTGADWVNLTDDWLPNLSVSTIAVDPVTPDTLYVGTGYCYNSIPAYNGSGLYQSMDGGKSFQRLNPASGAEDFIKVVVDPSAHNIVLASSYDKGAVYRSTDFGATWKSVFPSSGSSSTWDIIATPKSSGVFFLIGSAGVYKSTNDGSSWTKSSTASFPGSIGRSALASPTNAPSHVFALMTDPGGSLMYLFKSTDAGTTWAQDNSAPTDLFSVPGANHYQGWYDLYIAVSPNSVTSDTIYLGGVVAYLRAGSNSWQNFSIYDHSSGGGGYPHVDHHSFAFNPVNSNIVYDGDDGGLWVNYAAGSNDEGIGGGWQLHSLDMITSRFYNFTFEANPNVTWCGAQDQGLWKITAGQAPTFYPALGDAMQPLVSTQNVSHIYAEGPEGQVVQFTLPNPSYQPTADTAEGVTDACGWENPFKMSPVSASVNGKQIAGASILYIGRQHIWQSTNAGTNWTRLAPGFGQSPDGVFFCTAIGLPNWNANMIYGAGGGSSFELSTNFGVSWTTRANPGFVTDIATSWKDPKFVLVSLSSNAKKVMMSEDSGAHWTDVSGSAGAAIPGADSNTACNVMSIAIDSTDPLTTWYAGTDFGIYQTNDAGQHWTFMGPGLFPCRDVQIYSNGVTMRVGTYGRGIWEVQLPIVFDAVESNTLSATKSSAGTELSWNVQNEPAGAEFSIERSIDGNGFTSVGAVAGMGASEGSHPYTFTDNTTAPGTYLYQIHETDASGAQKYSNTVELHYGTDQLYLYQPYPNPFIANGGTAAVTMNFEIPVSDEVQIKIYSIEGKLVRTVADRNMAGGPQTASWDARDNEGNPVAPGTYFYSIQTANSGTASGKIMVEGE